MESAVSVVPDCGAAIYLNSLSANQFRVKNSNALRFGRSAE